MFHLSPLLAPNTWHLNILFNLQSDWNFQTGGTERWTKNNFLVASTSFTKLLATVSITNLVFVKYFLLTSIKERGQKKKVFSMRNNRKVNSKFSHTLNTKNKIVSHQIDFEVTEPKYLWKLFKVGQYVNSRVLVNQWLVEDLVIVWFKVHVLPGAIIGGLFIIFVIWSLISDLFWKF